MGSSTRDISRDYRLLKPTGSPAESFPVKFNNPKEVFSTNSIVKMK